MKTIERTSATQTLLGEVQMARIRLAKAQSELVTAREQFRSAKRRRKEARQAARRAKKEARRAKKGVAEAEAFLAEAEARLASARRPAPRRAITLKRSAVAKAKRRRRRVTPAAVAVRKGKVALRSRLRATTRQNRKKRAKPAAMAVRRKKPAGRRVPRAPKPVRPAAHAGVKPKTKRTSTRAIRKIRRKKEPSSSPAPQKRAAPAAKRRKIARQERPVKHLISVPREFEAPRPVQTTASDQAAAAQPERISSELQHKTEAIEGTKPAGDDDQDNNPTTSGPI
jgi:hypothetical protein